jgi:quercetin dioxygenase-like cupin family protein
MGEHHRKVLDLADVFGLTATVTTSASQTDGAYVEMDVVAHPGSQTMIHYHPEQEETYQVVEGTLEVFRDGQWQSVPAGVSMMVPPKMVHGFRNTTTAPVRFINVHRPALNFQAHLETVARLSRTGKIRGTKDPRSLMYMAMSAEKYKPDVAVKPPQWAVRMLAYMGRRLRLSLEGDG